MQEINCEILQDIILDHELCFVQKEELQKVIDLFSGINETVYIIPAKAVEKPIKLIFED
jgi:hypothetical protein